MKKFLILLLCLTLIFPTAVFSSAFEAQDKLTPAPEIKTFRATEKADAFEMEITHSLAAAEELRTMIYDLALEKYGSKEILLASPEKYLSYKTGLYLQASSDGVNWKTLRKLSANKVSVSLKKDVLPYSVNGISFLRVTLASENFKDKNAEKIYIYTPSETITILINDNLVIPGGVKFDMGKKTEKDITLFVPERKGYTFDGWSADGDTRVNKIPAGTKEITLTAHFIPRTYEINYVLTTNMTYPFGRADNTLNPDSYTVGEGAKLVSIKSPIGGFTFMGWYKSPDFTGEPVTEIGKTETGDKLLYAKWSSDEELEKIKYKERLQYIKDNKLGDPDGDGVVTAADARYIIRAVVGLDKVNYETLKRVDFFGTGKISSENARIALRISVGLDNLHDILLKNGLLPLN